MKQGEQLFLWLLVAIVALIFLQNRQSGGSTPIEYINKLEETYDIINWTPRNQYINRFPAFVILRFQNRDGDLNDGRMGFIGDGQGKATDTRLIFDLKQKVLHIPSIHAPGKAYKIQDFNTYFLFEDSTDQLFFHLTIKRNNKIVFSAKCQVENNGPLHRFYSGNKSIELHMVQSMLRRSTTNVSFNPKVRIVVYKGIVIGKKDRGLRLFSIDYETGSMRYRKNLTAPMRNLKENSNTTITLPKTGRGIRYNINGKRSAQTVMHKVKYGSWKSPLKIDLCNSFVVEGDPVSALGHCSLFPNNLNNAELQAQRIFWETLLNHPLRKDINFNATFSV